MHINYFTFFSNAMDAVFAFYGKISVYYFSMPVLLVDNDWRYKIEIFHASRKLL
jgi:hypothetical protein